MPDLPLDGTCRCGAVKIRIIGPPMMTSVCHCTGCQKMSGSAYSLTAMVPVDGFEVMAGEPVVGGLRGADLDHMFCPECMSWMFTRIKGVDQFLNVRPTLFEDISWFSPFIETMTREKLPWVETPAVHSFEGFPPMDRYQELVAEFMAASAG